jgi:tripartite-type tricarboxylate transporter receptor subunit TctC
MRVIVVAAAALAGLIAPAARQTWPTRPMTMIVPFAAGEPRTCSAASLRSA